MRRAIASTIGRRCRACASTSAWVGARGGVDVSASSSSSSSVASVASVVAAMRRVTFSTRAEWTPKSSTTFARGGTSAVPSAANATTAEYEAEVVKALDRACAQSSPVGLTVRGLIARLRRVEREAEYELERATRTIRAVSRQGGFFDMASVKRKRKKAMNKHKHRKRRRRDRHQNK
jgi:hypothetical protein